MFDIGTILDDLLDGYQLEYTSLCRENYICFNTIGNATLNLYKSSAHNEKEYDCPLDQNV